MAPEDIDKLSLADVRAIAERALDTLARLREVQALLGGAVAVSQPALPTVSTAAVPAHPTRTRTPIGDAEAANMAAQRAALLVRNREALPDDIKRAEGIQ